jgi:hypothetical protein
MHSISRKAIFAASVCVLALSISSGASAFTLLSEDFSGATPGPDNNLAGTQFTQSGGPVDIVGVLNGTFFSCAQNSGGNCVDMVGSPGNGKITSTTTFNLLANHLYTYSFLDILQGFSSGDPETSSFLFNVGGLSIVTYTATPDGESISAGFVAPISVLNAVLTIETITAPDTIHGADISNILLEDQGLQSLATPLPAALPLFAGGLGVLGFLARRRKQKQVTA